MHPPSALFPYYNISRLCWTSGIIWESRVRGARGVDLPRSGRDQSNPFDYVYTWVCFFLGVFGKRLKKILNGVLREQWPLLFVAIKAFRDIFSTRDLSIYQSEGVIKFDFFCGNNMGYFSNKHLW